METNSLAGGAQAAVQSATATSSPLTGAMGGNTLGQEAFLQLLVTQLTHQDPLNPQDGHEFVAQLAQFSSVEQLTNMSKAVSEQAEQLGWLAEATAAGAANQAKLSNKLTEQTTLSTASGMIGRSVDVAGNAAIWDGADPAALAFSIERPSASTTITIRNASGEVVRTIDAGHFGAGTHAPAWDGRDDNDRPLPPGAYTFSVDAKSASGAELDATTFTRGEVDRITVEAGAVRLWMGEYSFALGDVKGVN